MRVDTDMTVGVDKGGHVHPRGGHGVAENPYKTMKSTTSRTRREDVHAGGGGHVHLCPPQTGSVDRVANLILRHLADGGRSRGNLRHKLPNRDRQHFDQAIELLLDRGDLEVEAIEYRSQPGVLFRLSDRVRR